MLLLSIIEWFVRGDATDPDLVIIAHMVHYQQIPCSFFKFSRRQYDLPDFAFCDPGHLLWCTVKQDFPIVDDSHGIAGTGNIFDDVCGKDHNAVAAELNQQVPEPDAFPWIQSRCRFIYHQDPWQVKQNLCDANPLFHTA